MVRDSSLIVGDSSHSSLVTQMLHGAGIFTYKTGPVLGVNVGKYSNAWSIWVMVGDFYANHENSRRFSELTNV